MRQQEPEDKDELTLIYRATEGDHEAFRSLVVLYEAQLLGYLTHMLGDSESAQDIAQETFVAIFHALPRWQPHLVLTDHDPFVISEDREGNESYLINAQPATSRRFLAPWLYRIATNRAISLLRKNAVRTRIHVSRLHDNSCHALSAEQTTRSVKQEPSIEDQYVARELLSEALSRLPKEDAACLVLHYIEGERYAEIAVRLGLTSEAVRKRISRALITLRKVYATLDMEVYTHER